MYSSKSCRKRKLGEQVKLHLGILSVRLGKFNAFSVPCSVDKFFLTPFFGLFINATLGCKVLLGKELWRVWVRDVHLCGSPGALWQFQQLKTVSSCFRRNGSGVERKRGSGGDSATGEAAQWATWRMHETGQSGIEGLRGMRRSLGTLPGLRGLLHAMHIAAFGVSEAA